MTKHAQTPPPRGFAEAEFARRCQATQALMLDQGFDALLFTTEPEVRYYTGFLTQFWESPSRPWFLVVPLEDKPIAVIPEIGQAGMAATWVEDIRTWPAPQPEDDGISLLTATLLALPRRFGRLGLPLGHETLLRMPAQDFEILRGSLGNLEISDCTTLVRSLRNIKSKAEIEKIAYACDLTSAAFQALPTWARQGQSERQVCQQLRQDLLARGADNSPYLIAGSGAGGYDSIIMGPGRAAA